MIALIAALMAALLTATAFGEAKNSPVAEGPASQRPSDEIDVTEMANLTVVVLDEQNLPIAGAEVMAYAMRMREGGGHGYWDQKVYGPPKTIITDGQGMAPVPYPIHVRVGPEVMTTRLVTFSVTHADFVKQTVHFDLGPKAANVVLKPGCELVLSAADADRQPIEEFGVVMAGPQSPELWAIEEDGSRRSRAVNEGTWQTMLVKLQEDGPTLFSHVLPLSFRPGQQVRFRNIQLRPGVTIRGTLSENVPRPVTGYVIATALPLPAGNTWDDEDPSLAWHDWVDISPDGSFVFESLPRTGVLQLIVVCKGWISTTKLEEARSQVMGQIFTIEGEGDEQSVTVEMEPTGTLEVSLVTADGQPFTEGRVSSWPNQRYLKGGSTLLGQRYQSSAFIKNQSLPPEERAHYYINQMLTFPYTQEISAAGKVTLSGLPIRRSEQFVLNHDSFVLADGGGRHEISFTLNSPEPVEMTAKVVSAPDRGR